MGASFVAFAMRAEMPTNFNYHTGSGVWFAN
jgi:hypothetical protein